MWVGSGSASAFRAVCHNALALHRRVPVKHDEFEKALAATRDEVEEEVIIDCERTTVERELHKFFGSTAGQVTNGLVSEVTKVLVFQSEELRDRFVTAFFRKYKAGVVAAGGGANVFDKAVECMRQATPLFVFRGTGGASAELCHLVEMGLRRLHKTGEIDTTVVTKPAKPGHPQPVEKENEVHDQEVVKARKRELTEFAEKKLRTNESKLVGCNFPDLFSAETVLIIDVTPMGGATISTAILQEDISSVMSTVFEMGLNELGGASSDRRIIEKAMEMELKLELTALG